MAAPASPMATPTTPAAAMVIGELAASPAQVVDARARECAHQRGDDQRDRRDDDARLAEAGELLLDDTVRRLRDAGLHQLRAVVGRQRGEPPIEFLAVDARRVLHEHLRHRRLTAE